MAKNKNPQATQVVEKIEDLQVESRPQETLQVVTIPKIEGLPEGVTIVELPEIARSARARVQIPQNPAYVELAKAVSQPGKNLHAIIPGTAKVEDLEAVGLKILSRTDGEQLTNNEMFFLLMGYLPLEDFEPMVSGEGDQKKTYGKITVDYFYSKLMLGDPTKVNVFIYHQGFRSYKALMASQPEEVNRFTHFIHFYQVLMGVLQKEHNARTWLRFFDSIQTPSTPVEGSGLIKWRYVSIWGSEAYLSFMNKVYRDGKTWYQTLREKASQLGVYSI